MTSLNSEGRTQQALRAGEGATTMVADPLGRVLVTDTRAGQLLVFGVDPLIERQAYPVPEAPYGLAGSRNLTWVSQTASNMVVGYDLTTGIPVEKKVRYPTVQQPNSLAFDDKSDTLYVVSAAGAGGAGDPQRGGRPMSAAHRGGMPASWEVELSDDYEWIPLRLPPDVTRISASTRLSIEAEYRGGWELTRVRLYTDGSRRVLLRRKKSRFNGQAADQPEL